MIWSALLSGRRIDGTASGSTRDSGAPSPVAPAPMTAPLQPAATASAPVETAIRRELVDWQAMVKPYQRADRGRALWQIVNTVGPFLALWVAMYLVYPYSIVATLALGAVGSFLLVRLFIIQHDCGHQSFFAERRRNDALGWVCSLLTTVPYTYWSRVHAFHHGHTGQLEHRNVGDIDFLTVDEYRARGAWDRFRYRVFRSPFVLTVVAPLLYITVMVRIPKVSLPGWGGVHLRLLANNLALAALYLGLGYLLGWARFAVVQGTLVLGFATIAFWFFYVQHQHEQTYMRWTGNWDFLLAAIRGATFYDLPRAFHWLTGNIGYHHVHHLSSRIPNYNLARCARENPLLQKYVTRIGFLESIPLLNNKLWDERGGRMISFREFGRREAAA